MKIFFQSSSDVGAAFKLRARNLKVAATLPRGLQSAFTMMEIAISLAVIGIALVAIIGILPLGLRTQRENREKTLINQDATVFMEAIRNGVRANSSDTYLTNYVFAITNYQTLFNPSPGTTVTIPFDGRVLTNNYVIIGLLSTPEFAGTNGKSIPVLIPNLPGGCYSNHIVAYVHALSGLAEEKPPQTNPLLLQNTFGYRLLCQNLPIAFSFPTNWEDSPVTYNKGDKVYFPTADGVAYWQSLANANSGNVPTNSPNVWSHDGYTQTLANNARELRLTFQWALRPNSTVGTGRQTYRTFVTGQLAVDMNTLANANLYFFEPGEIETNKP